MKQEVDGDVAFGSFPAPCVQSQTEPRLLHWDLVQHFGPLS